MGCPQSQTQSGTDDVDSVPESDYRASSLFGVGRSVARSEGVFASVAQDMGRYKDVLI